MTGSAKVECGAEMTGPRSPGEIPNPETLGFRRRARAGDARTRRGAVGAQRARCAWTSLKSTRASMGGATSRVVGRWVAVARSDARTRGRGWRRRCRSRCRCAPGPWKLKPARGASPPSRHTLEHTDVARLLLLGRRHVDDQSAALAGAGRNRHEPARRRCRKIRTPRSACWCARRPRRWGGRRTRRWQTSWRPSRTTVRVGLVCDRRRSARTLCASEGDDTSLCEMDKTLLFHLLCWCVVMGLSPACVGFFFKKD